MFCPTPVPYHDWGYRVSDISTSLRALLPRKHLFATGCYKPCRGTPLCVKKWASLFTRPFRVRRVGIQKLRKARSLTGPGMYAAVSALILKDALHLHSTYRLEANSRFKLGYDVVSLLISICILSSSFSLSLFAVTRLQLNATSVMGMAQGDINSHAAIFVDTQVGLATFLLSLYLLFGAHCWLLCNKARGPNGMTRARSAAAAIGITLLRFSHADPLLPDF